MSARRAVLLVLVSAAATLLLGWAARAEYSPRALEHGLLRLSWRWRGERAESCRPRTQEELDALPVHMRTPEVCSERRVHYRLILQLDGAAPETTWIAPAGAKGDRPIYVLVERPLAPGEHRVRLEFGRQGEGEGEGEGERGRRRHGEARGHEEEDEGEDDGEDEDDDAREKRAVRMTFDGVLRAERGAIELITVEQGTMRLVHRSGGRNR